MGDFTIGMLACGGGLIILIWIVKQATRNYKEEFAEEERKFIEHMHHLGEEKEIDNMMGQLNSFEELKKLNRKIERAINKTK